MSVPFSPFAARMLSAALVAVGIGVAASGNAFTLRIAASSAIFYILIASFNLIYGYAGLMSLAHVGIYGVGAYAAVLLQVKLDVPFWLSMPIGVMAALLVSLIIAYPTARINGLFLAIGTLGAGIFLEEYYLKAKLTGGSLGIGGIPQIPFFGLEMRGGTLAFYIFVAVIAILVFEVMHRISGTRLGRRFVTLRESPLDTQSVGLDPFKVRVIAFSLGGAFAGLAGVLFAHMAQFISYQAFSIAKLIDVIIVTLIGGAGTVLGPLIGVVGLIALLELGHRIGDLTIALGAGIILLNAYAPNGVAGFSQRVLSRRPAIGKRKVQELIHLRERSVSAPTLTAQKGEALLAATDVSVGFQGVQALTKVSLTLRSGETLGLIGPNGAGKTTMVNVMSGHVTPTSGTVTLNDLSLVGLPPFRIAQEGLVRTFQKTRLVRSFDLLTNVMIGRDAFGRASLAEDVLGVGRARTDDEEARMISMQLLELVGIGDLALVSADAVPYGVLRRAEMAKALAMEPRVLLLDEPGAGLSSFERTEVADAIQAVHERNVGCLVIDHNVEFVANVSDRIAVLTTGLLLAEGPAQEILSDPAVIAAYLGKAVDS